MKTLSAFLLSVIIGPVLIANDCNMLKLTTNTYSESDDLISCVQSEIGSDYTIADWNDLKDISNIDEWIACMELSDEIVFMLTRDGEYFYNSTRHYLVGYYENGVPGNWLVHDQINDKLFLGSWYDLDYQILAKRIYNSNECNALKMTCNTYSETDDLVSCVQSEYGSDYTIADWNDLHDISNINEWIACMELSDEIVFMLTRDGEYFYNSTRHYLVGYYENGVPGNWLVHDQIDGKLFLGSWYDLNYGILAKNMSFSMDELLTTELKVYPNPAINELNISAEGFTIEEVIIYTKTGQQVLVERLIREKIDISNLQPGMYIVEVTLEGRMVRRKLLVQR